jgi:hypothetical protein
VCESSQNGHPTKKRRKRQLVRSDPDWEEAFAEGFWPDYLAFKPGCSRAAAFEAFCAIPHPDGEPDFLRLDKAFTEYRDQCAADGKEPKHRKDASTWLNDYNRNLSLEEIL